MCHICSEFNSSGNNTIYSAWHKYGLPDKVKKSPFHVRGYGKCPVCGVVRPQHEMFPSNHCEKPLCEPCYNKLFVQNLSERCGVCGDWLSKEKNEQVRMNPRELKPHCCDWECSAFLIDRFARTLLPHLIARYPDDFDNHCYQPWNHSGIVNAEYEDVTSQRALGPGQRAIAPGSTQTMNEWMNENGNNRNVHDENVYCVPIHNYKIY